MATVADSREQTLEITEIKDLSNSKSVEITEPWIVQTLHQAEIAQKTIQRTLDSFIHTTKYRIHQINSTSVAHLHQTIESLEDIKTKYYAYEDAIFGKVKEGILVAVSYPMLTFGISVGVGILGLKRSRRFLYHTIRHLFLSQEDMLLKATDKVEKLKRSAYELKLEGSLIEKRAISAEEELIRGSKKLRQTGNQIQSAIRTAYKIERQAVGLKEILGELPHAVSKEYWSSVSRLASEAKQGKKELAKVVLKIHNYGI